jgi:endonuclease/exonuclease/phosphatase family metal-dependent hydrolase
MNIKVLTYNIWGMPWGTKSIHEILLWLFCQSGAEVICLQEVFSKYHRHIIREKAKAAHWQVFFPEDPCWAGMCLNAYHSGSGLCILVSPRIKVIQDIPFTAYEHVGAYVERLVKKGFFGVTLEKKGVRFHVLNTHMISDITECSPLRIAHGHSRRFQEKQLIEAAQKFQNPILIAGDLNQEEHHYFHRMYPHEDWTFLSTFEQLDHVVCLPSKATMFRVKNVHFYQDIHYSDHIPLLVKVHINEKCKPD